jgi:hypothetical protein
VTFSNCFNSNQNNDQPTNSNNQPPPNSDSNTSGNAGQNDCSLTGFDKRGSEKIESKSTRHQFNFPDHQLAIQSLPSDVVKFDDNYVLMMKEKLTEYVMKSFNIEESSTLKLQ